jgi:Amino acid permease
VAEDGVLPEWFRQPNNTYGTTSRLISMVVILQIATIVISRGNVYMLGEAYAFGVVWSFAMKALSVLVLRYKMPHTREYKVPLNPRVGNREVPVGLALITLALFSLACINVITKKVATISGLSFTFAFFVIFELSERYNRRKEKAHGQMEKFRLETNEEVSQGRLNVRPGSVLVPVRNPNALDHLQKVLENTDTRKQDIVALSVHRLTQAASSEYDLEAGQIFSSAETEVFTRVVALAEKAGKHVDLLAVASTDPWLAMVQTARDLHCSTIVTGLSPLYQFNPNEQGKIVGEAWEKLPQPLPAVRLEVVLPNPTQSLFFSLGPHPPRLWPEDVDLVHRLWLELSGRGTGSKLHHRDVVGVALRRLEQQLHSEHAQEVIEDIDREVEAHPPEPPVIGPPKGSP